MKGSIYTFTLTCRHILSVWLFHFQILVLWSRVCLMISDRRSSPRPKSTASTACASRRWWGGHRAKWCYSCWEAVTGERPSHRDTRGGRGAPLTGEGFSHRDMGRGGGGAPVTGVRFKNRGGGVCSLYALSVYDGYSALQILKTIYLFYHNKFHGKVKDK